MLKLKLRLPFRLLTLVCFVECLGTVFLCSCLFFSTGAGLDTLYFWLTDLWSPSLLRLYECDYPEVISKKLSIFTRYVNCGRKCHFCARGVAGRRSALWDRLGHDQTRRSMENIIHDGRAKQTPSGAGFTARQLY